MLASCQPSGVASFRLIVSKVKFGFKLAGLETFPGGVGVVVK